MREQAEDPFEDAPSVAGSGDAFEAFEDDGGDKGGDAEKVVEAHLCCERVHLLSEREVKDVGERRRRGGEEKEKPQNRQGVLARICRHVKSGEEDEEERGRRKRADEVPEVRREPKREAVDARHNLQVLRVVRALPNEEHRR